MPRIVAILIGCTAWLGCPGRTESGTDSGVQVVCGNLVVETGEQCDGVNLATASCITRGFKSGALKCTVACQYDTTACSNEAPATFIINEVTSSGDDGVEFFNPGPTAVSLAGWSFVDDDPSHVPYVFDGGMLAPGAYLILDKATDGGFPLHWDGNAFGLGDVDAVVLKDPAGNVIDRVDYPANAAVVSYCRIPNATGAFVTCGKRTFGASNGTCGNKAIETGDTCDGSDLASQTCATQGFVSGALSCLPDCTSFVTTGCTQCGNNTVDSPERCDGTALLGQTCVSSGFASGTLGCKADCSGVEELNCVPDARCGNDALDLGEACDGAKLADAGCNTLDAGFAGGTLACHRSCSRYDSSACSNCGNGIREVPETCDRNDFGPDSCKSRGFASGYLRCTAACAVDGTHCSNVVVNDVSSANPDKIELANLGATSASLSGWTMLDNNNTSALYRFPDLATLAPNASMLLMATIVDGGPGDFRFGLGGADSVRLFDGVPDFLDGGTASLVDGTSWISPNAVESWCRRDGGFAVCAVSCGNSNREGGEECDLVDLGGKTCGTYAPATPNGTLACSSTCRFEVAGCLP